MNRQQVIILAFGLTWTVGWPIGGYLTLKLNPRKFVPGPTKTIGKSETEKYWRDYEVRRRRMVMRLFPALTAITLVATLVGVFLA